MMNIIREAMGAMAKRGFCKWTQEDQRGHVCVAGALARAHFNGDGNQWTRELQPYMQLIADVAREQYPDRAIGNDNWGSAAVHFNNHKDTVIEDVLRVMDKAAVRLD